MTTLPFDRLTNELDAMFCAVEIHLRRAHHGSRDPSHPQGIDANDRIRASVVDCMTELGALHSMLAQGAEHRHRLERIVDDARAALARAPAEFADMLDLTLRASPVGRLSDQTSDQGRKPARAT